MNALKIFFTIFFVLGVVLYQAKNIDRKMKKEMYDNPCVNFKIDTNQSNSNSKNTFTITSGIYTSEITGLWGRITHEFNFTDAHNYNSYLKLDTWFNQYTQRIDGNYSIVGKQLVLNSRQCEGKQKLKLLKVDDFFIETTTSNSDNVFTYLRVYL